MTKPIGSDFEISSEPRTKKEMLSKYLPECKKSISLSSGSDSIYYLLKSLDLGGKIVLLPSYLCEDIIKPIDKLKIKYRFYAVNKDLSINLIDLKKKIKKSLIVFVIHYFGFPAKNLKRIIKLCKREKAIIVEDCVHSPLTRIDNRLIGGDGNFSFNSLRKVLPVPDGSYLCMNIKCNNIKTVDSGLHRKYINSRYNAMKQKHRYLKNPEKTDDYYFKKSFMDVDRQKNNYPAPAPISSTTKRLLQKIDLAKAISKRRANFIYLSKNIRKLSGIKPLYRLKKGVCPLGFPIICKNRNKIKQALIEHKIYPPIHWVLPKSLSRFKDSYWLSNHILTIPIDQRYNTRDMERIIGVLKNV